MSDPFPIDEYRSRLETAAAELEAQAADTARSVAERARLAAKAAGVALALSYWNEHEPAPAPAGGGDPTMPERTADLYPYIVIGVESGHDPHRTLHGAVADAEGRIDDCLDDIWSEEVDEILVARVTHRAVRTVMGRRPDMAPEAWAELTGGRTDVDEWWSYALEPVDHASADASTAVAETVEPAETTPCGEQPVDQTTEEQMGDPVVAAAARRSARVAMAKALPHLEAVDRSLQRSGELAHRPAVAGLVDTFAGLIADGDTAAERTPDALPAEVIVASDWFNAIYLDGRLRDEGRPDRFDAETLARTYPDAAMFTMPQDVYDEVLDGAGYPPELADLPIGRLTRVR